MDPFQFFLILSPFALVSSASILIYAWRQRSRPLARMLVWVVVPVCGYLITNTLELIAPTAAGTLFWARTGYLFAPVIGVVWLLFALEYTGKRGRLSRLGSWAIWIVPVVSNILVQTNDLHHLIWTQTVFSHHGTFLALSVSYGAWFWVNAVYSYVLLLTGAFLLVREYFHSFKTYRQQTLWLLIGRLCR